MPPTVFLYHTTPINEMLKADINLSQVTREQRLLRSSYEQVMRSHFTVRSAHCGGGGSVHGARQWEHRDSWTSSAWRRCRGRPDSQWTAASRRPLTIIDLKAASRSAWQLSSHRGASSIVSTAFYWYKHVQNSVVECVTHTSAHR